MRFRRSKSPVIIILLVLASITPLLLTKNILNVKATIGVSEDWSYTTGGYVNMAPAAFDIDDDGYPESRIRGKEMGHFAFRLFGAV